MIWCMWSRWQSYTVLLPLLFDVDDDQNDDDVCIKWSKMLIFFDSDNLSIHLL